MNKTATVYFKNLDGLRTICFLLVFLFHSFTTNNQSILQSPSYRFLKGDIFGNGNLGVNIFFVLSGFLISFLLLTEQENHSKINLPKFWMRRVLRIWPLYFFCVFIGFVAFPMIKAAIGETPQETAHLWRYLTFTNNFDFIKYGRPDASVLGVLWSVAIEEQFYLIWPILFVTVKRKSLWIPMLLLLMVSYWYRAAHPDYMHYEFHSLSCMNDLLIGGLIGWTAKEKPALIRFLVEKGKPILYCSYALFVLLFFFRDEAFYWNDTLKPFERLFTAVIIGLIIIDQSFNTSSPLQLHKFKLLSQLGKYTYGLYCLQFVAILIVVTITKKIIGFDNPFGVFFLEPVISLILNVILARTSYIYFESFFLKLKTRFN